MNMRIMPKIYFTLTSPLWIMFLLIVAMTGSVNASEDLWAVLKGGGKVILMRHAPVERGAESGSSLLRDPSCKSERKLSSQGKRDAEMLGSRFREHDIPVSRVMHSPFCRTTATAQITFGVANPVGYLSLLEILSPDEAMQQTEELNQVIGTYTGDGNLILVTHEPNINAVSFELMKYLDFLVLDPGGEGGFEELGVIRFSEQK